MFIDDIAIIEQVFEEVRVDNLEEAISAYERDGYARIGDHFRTQAAILKNAEGFVILFKPKIHEDVPLSRGYVVDNPRSILVDAKRNGLDIFDSGSVGALELNFMAIREENGRISYFIRPIEIDSFFLVNFRMIT